MSEKKPTKEEAAKYIQEVSKELEREEREKRANRTSAEVWEDNMGWIFLVAIIVIWTFLGGIFPDMNGGVSLIVSFWITTIFWCAICMPEDLVIFNILILGLIFCFLSELTELDIFPSIVISIVLTMVFYVFVKILHNGKGG